VGVSEDAPSARQLARLLRAVQDLSRAGSLPDVQQVIRTAARDLADADGAALVLRDGDHVHGWSMTNASAVVIEDVSLDDRVPQGLHLPTSVRSLLMVPIRPEEPLGAICSYWAQQTRPTPAIVDLVRALADSTASAIEHVRLLADLERRVAERTKALSRRLAQLQVCARERRLLAREAMHAEERERTLLSEIIHDDALQYVLAARQELADAAKGRAGALDRAGSDLDAAHRSLRTLVAELSPVSLQSSSLGELIAAAVRTYTAGRGFSVVTQLGEGIRPVHGQFLVRATRELLANVSKHTRARTVTVGLEQVDSTLELTVADDGAGFDLEDLPRALRAGSVGLASLRNRADGLGGALIVESSRAGTRVTVRVPAVE
jgi:signal transduction histidine kinase